MVVGGYVCMCRRHRRHWWQCPIGEFVAGISGGVQCASTIAAAFSPRATGEADASDTPAKCAALRSRTAEYAAVATSITKYSTASIYYKLLIHSRAMLLISVFIT